MRRFETLQEERSRRSEHVDGFARTEVTTLYAEGSVECEADGAMIPCRGVKGTSYAIPLTTFAAVVARLTEQSDHDDERGWSQSGNQFVFVGGRRHIEELETRTDLIGYWTRAKPLAQKPREIPEELRRHVATAQQLIARWFGSDIREVVQLVRDPEIDDEFVEIGIVVAGEPEQILNAYDRYTADWVATVPASARERIRLSYEFA